MKKIFLIITILLIVAIPTYAEAEKQSADNSGSYAKGLKKYMLACKPWLDDDEVAERVNSQIKTIKEKPDSLITKTYLERIENASLTAKQRVEKFKRKMLEAIQELSVNEKLKKRMVELTENFDLEVTQKDYQNFFHSQTKDNENFEKVKSYFMFVLLLRSNEVQRLINYYSHLPENRLKDGFYSLYSSKLHVYDKSPEHYKFHRLVIRDLLTRKSDSVGLDPKLLSDFMLVLQDLRAIGYFQSLDLLIKNSFNNPSTNNKARYAFVVAALQTYRHDVSLKFAKKYYTNYSGDIDELVYLTKFFYMYWPREKIDPVVEAKVEELMQPAKAVMKEMPKD